jgi:hypothetical protein
MLADEMVASLMTLLRRVWRDQRCNQIPYFKEQIWQWRKEKVQKEKQWFTKHIYKAKGQVTGVHIKNWVNSGAYRRVCRSWSTSDTSHGNIVTNLIISREWVKDREVLTISGTYRLSLWHRYAIVVNHVMVVTVAFSKWWFHLCQKEFLFQ